MIRHFLLLVDDVVVGIPVHIGGGYFGLLSTALFKENGLILSPSKQSAFVIASNMHFAVSL